MKDRSHGLRLASLPLAIALVGVVAESPVPAHAAPLLTCTLTVNDPHGSTHVSGTINVTATTSCPLPMTSIYLDVELMRVSPSAKTYFAKPGVTAPAGYATWTQNESTSCSQGPGTFRGWATTSIVPPPGYVLDGSGTYAKYGTTVSVACGAAFAPTSETAGGSTVITIGLTPIG